jgi:hypothetical protein
MHYDKLHCYHVSESVADCYYAELYIPILCVNQSTASFLRISTIVPNTRNQVSVIRNQEPAAAAAASEAGQGRGMASIMMRSGRARRGSAPPPGRRVRRCVLGAATTTAFLPLALDPR